MSTDTAQGAEPDPSPAGPTETALTTRAGIAARFERLPLSRWHVTVRLIVGVVTFFEAFDQLLIAYALPELRDEWHLTTGDATAVLTVGSAGMLVGALLSGRLADRYGRVKVIAYCVAASGLASLALTACTSLTPFLALRFLQGLAIGGEVPVAAAFISEITRSFKRGRFVLLYELVFPAGLTVGALVAAWVVPAAGWRVMFAVAAVPGLLAFLVQRRVPESPRWLADRGRLTEADAVMSGIEAKVSAATGQPLPPPVAAPAAPAPSPAPAAGTATPAERAATGVRGLFTGRYRRRTLVVGAIWFTGYFVNYGVTSWLPSIYKDEYGLGLSDALLYSTVTSVAGLLGCLFVALTVDVLGRRRIFAVCLGASAALLLTLAALGAHSPVQVLIWTSLSAVGFFGSNICLYLYTPELYPTRMRALGCSVGGAVNRLGVILGPILVGVVYAANDSVVAVFVMLGAVAVIGAVVAGTLAEETANRPLEEISP
ncbi:MULTISPECIES: MFS transporter [unclassified Streptomyces]|uniref:MFS transporter n=1 Tax=unclassified Streptomyces TaxID=2593676 RepID=UPI0022574100|nr:MULTISPECIES: MFS transporter [unclassified Streptomyces]MCX5139610.1 MFS transporter [Streptomyces sp. NBC_00338]WRZ64275.1 MFS transporter [Streptomyces sp. NBC_01257]WSU58238.1 MFS transporter [Streptomyces sp. NBC_01104]